MIKINYLCILTSHKVTFVQKMKQNLQTHKVMVATTGGNAITANGGIKYAMPPGTMECIMQDDKLDVHINLMWVLSSSVEQENANGTNVGRNTRKGLVKTLLKNPGWQVFQHAYKKGGRSCPATMTMTKIFMNASMGGLKKIIRYTFE